jgi:hypothetical protein
MMVHIWDKLIMYRRLVRSLSGKDQDVDERTVLKIMRTKCRFPAFNCTCQIPGRYQIILWRLHFYYIVNQIKSQLDV